MFTYQKKDKLKSRKQTQDLFAKGQSINAFPIKLIYTIEEVPEADTCLQVGVAAPSRTFRKAVQRNRVKRLLREGYRLERPAFMHVAAIQNKRINIFFLYIDAIVLSQEQIQAKIKMALTKLQEKLK